MDLHLTQDIITESELPMGRLIPTTRTKRSLRHFWMLQHRHPSLRLRLFYQTGLVSPGRDNSNNETGFKIQRKTGVTGTYVDIATTAANVTGLQRYGPLADGTVYCYRVCATNATGDSAFSNEASGTTPLAKPTSATATAVSSSQINLTWVDNSASETGYKIERKTTADWHLCADRPGGCKCAEL